MQTVKSVFGVTKALMPVLYCGSLAYYFVDTGQSLENISATGMGPTVVGLSAIGFLFTIPLILKVMKLFRGPRAPGSGGRPDEPDDSGFDPDAAIARYMASKQTADVAPPAPAPRAIPRSAAPARPTGFGRRIS